MELISCVVFSLYFFLFFFFKQKTAYEMRISDWSSDVCASDLAVDTETMGLVTPRDRLCLVQIADGNGDEHLVRFSPGSDFAAPNLRAVLADPARLKIYHFARFDLAAIRAYLGVVA